MASFLIQPDADGMCCGCEVKTDACTPCGFAPCSLFEPDDTRYGERTLNNSMSGTISWTDLPVGAYQIIHVSHAWALFTTACGPSYWISGDGINPMTWTTNDSGGSLPANTTHDWFCPDDSSINLGFASESEAVDDYQSKFPSGFLIGDSVFPDDVDVAYFGNAGPQPVFDLERTLKLIASQPTKLTVLLDTFNDGRWTASYLGAVTEPLRFDASASDVEIALNDLATITSDGGVTCTGNLTDGVDVTWNANGNRAQIEVAITTANPGLLLAMATTTEGTISEKEVQTITLSRPCADCNADEESEPWDGSIEFVQFGFPIWTFHENDPRDYLVLPIVTNNLQLNGSQFATALVHLVQHDPGNVGPGKFKWVVTFTTAAGESTASPQSIIANNSSGFKVPVTLPIGPSGTLTRKLYRTVANGSVFKLVTEIADNVTLQYEDNTADGGLGAAPPGSSAVPPSPTPPLPRVCEFRLMLFCFQTLFGSLVSRLIWLGAKRSGDNPEGVYMSLNDFNAVGQSVCGYSSVGTVKRLTVAGSDFIDP